MRFVLRQGREGGAGVNDIGERESARVNAARNAAIGSRWELDGHVVTVRNVWHKDIYLTIENPGGYAAVRIDRNVFLNKAQPLP